MTAATYGNKIFILLCENGELFIALPNYSLLLLLAEIANVSLPQRLLFSQPLAP